MRSRSANAAALYQSCRVAIAGILADRKPQLGENRALDLGQRQFIDGLAERRKISLERWIWQSRIPATESGGMIRALRPDRNPPAALFVQCDGMILCKDRADLPPPRRRLVIGCARNVANQWQKEERAMRLMIEIAAAALLVFCISATSAAFAAGKAGRSADGLSCAFSVPPTPRPRRAVPRSAGNAAENSTPIIAATSCCRRCETETQRCEPTRHQRPTRFRWLDRSAIQSALYLHSLPQPANDSARRQSYVAADAQFTSRIPNAGPRLSANGRIGQCDPHRRSAASPDLGRHMSTGSNYGNVAGPMRRRQNSTARNKLRTL